MSVEIFRTSIPIIPSQRKISYQTPSLLMGSCFTENIGEKLMWYKFPSLINPFGITYNPFSIKKNLERIITQPLYSSEEINFYNGLYFSFDHHSRFSDPDIELCLDKINTSLIIASEILKKSHFLFLTFGTSFYYTQAKTGHIVSNCHKLPDKEFHHARLTVHEIVDAYTLLIPKLQETNPNLQIIFTVSPIRHWKDGAHENQLSKAVLLLSIEELCKRFEFAQYFPAYELMLDELRDYRFYEEDMLHPNRTAINFIWKRFHNCYMDVATSQVMLEIEKIQLARQHRPFNIQSEVFQSFVMQQIHKIEQLAEQYPHIDLVEENKYFRSFIG